MPTITMHLANADQKDTDTALAIGGLLNDLDNCNSAFRHCSIRSLEDIDHPDGHDESVANPLEDFDPKDGEHCRILVDRLLKLLNRAPSCLNRVLWGYSTLRSNKVIDLDCDHLALHPDLVAAKEKAKLYDDLKIHYFTTDTREGMQTHLFRSQEALAAAILETVKEEDPQIAQQLTQHPFQSEEWMEVWEQFRETQDRLSNHWYSFGEGEVTPG